MKDEKPHEDALAMLKEGMPLTVVAEILDVKVIDISHLDDKNAAK